jgi:hypothetical protein
VQSVSGVEPRVLVRPAAIQRVQVQRGRPALEHFLDRDVLAELVCGDVLGQVVVDELAEVGKPGRDARPAVGGPGGFWVPVGCLHGHRGRHRFEDHPLGIVDGFAFRPQAGEPELARVGC